MIDNTERAITVKNVPPEVAKSYISAKVQGDKVTRLKTSGTYRTIMAQLVQLVASLIINMEKAYGVSKDKSVAAFESMLDKTMGE